MQAANDPIQYVLDRPMSCEPGLSFSYNSGTSMILGAIIEQVSGLDARTFAAKYLFQVVGIEDIQWLKLKDAYHTDGGLYMRIDDMARFGYLFLNNGVWDSQQIVSSDWIADASTMHYSISNAPYGYGYQWWTFDASTVYLARGHYDQTIYVAPDHDLVVAIIANVADEEPHIIDRIILEYILPSIDLDWEKSEQNNNDFPIIYIVPSMIILLILVEKRKLVVRK